MSRRDRGDRDRCPSAHTGADEGAGSRPLACRGAHCAPAVFSHNPRRGRVSSPACRLSVGAAHWAARPPNRRTPPQFPVYVSKRPTKGQIPPYLSSPKPSPHRGPTPLVKGPIPPVRGKWPKAKRGRDDGRRPEGIGTSGMEAGAANLPPINETALSSSPHPSGLRPATFPPGGRLKSRRRRNPLRFKTQLSCKSCFSSASRFSASMGDKMFTSVIRSLLRTVCPPRSMRDSCS